MATTVIVVALVALVAVAIGLVASRRRPDAPTAPTFAAPQQLDRADFDEPDRPWLLALFSSETCLSCHEARTTLEPVQFRQVVVQDVPVETHKAVHDRYAVDAVPIVVLADAEGVVRWSFLGAPPPEAIRDVLVDIDVLRPDEGTSVAFP